MPEATYQLNLIVAGREQGVTQVTQAAQRGLEGVGQASARAAAQADQLTARIGFQQRELSLLERQLSATAALHGADSIQAGRQQLAIDRLTASVQRNQQSLQGLSQGMGQAQGQAGRLGGAIQNIQGQLGTLTSALGTVGIGLGAGALVKGTIELAQLGGQVQQTRVQFDQLAATAGTTGSALLSALQHASKGEISDLNLELAANRAQLLGVADSAEEFSTLMDIARDRAQKMGSTTTQAFNDLVTGLGRGSPLILDNLGITLSVAEANETYAKSIHKTVSQLTEAEQKQALINAVLAQGRRAIQETGGAAETSATSFQQLTAAFENAKAQAGELAAIRLGPLAEDAAKVMNALTGHGSIQEGIGGLAELAGRVSPQIQIFEGLKGAIDGAGGALARFAGIQLPDQFSPLQNSINAWGQLLGIIPPATDATAQNTQAAAVNSQAITYQSQAMLDAAAAGQPAAQAILDTASASAESAEKSIVDAANKNAQAAQTQLLAAQTQQAADAFLSLNPNVDAAGIAALVAAGKIPPLIGQLAAAALQAREARAALAAFNLEAGIQATKAKLDNRQVNNLNVGRDADDVTAGKHREVTAALRTRQQVTDQASAAEARYQQTLGNDGPARHRLELERDAAKQRGDKTSYFEAMDGLAKLDQAEEQAAKKGKGRAGGAGAAKLSDQAKLNNTLQANELKSNQQLENLEASHLQKLLKIDADFAAKQLAQQQANETGKRRSRYDFYKSIADLDQASQQQLSQAYEQAFQESQQLAQQGNQRLAADHLRMRQEQIRADADYYKERKAIQESDQGDDEKAQALRRLDDLDAMRRDAEREELAQLQAKGDDLQNEHQQQLAQEQQAYLDSQEKIGVASDQAASRKIAAHDAARGAAESENAVLREQIGLFGQLGSAQSAAGGGSSNGGGAPNRAAGGGTFLTRGPTTLTVGDNPGGQELVHVVPLSGRGTTSVGHNMLALAGGGTVLAGGAQASSSAGGGAPTDSAASTLAEANQLIALVQEYAQANHANGDVLKRYGDSVGAAVGVINDIAQIRGTLAQPTAPPIDAALVRSLADDARTVTEIVRAVLVPTTEQQGKDLDAYAKTVNQSVDVLKDVLDLKKGLAERARYPVDIQLVHWLAQSAREVARVVRMDLVPTGQDEADGMGRYAESVGQSVAIVTDVLDLKKGLAERARYPVDIQLVHWLAQSAREVARVVRMDLVPTGQDEADGMGRYAESVGQSVGIVTDVLDLKKGLAERARVGVDVASIQGLANDAKLIARVVRTELLPTSTDQGQALGAYAEAAGKSIGLVKDTLSLSGAMFDGYVSPSDAQITRIVADANRIARRLVQAASSYKKEGLEGAKAFSEAVGGTFSAFKDGLLFFQALNSGDFVPDPAKFRQFEQATAQTMEVARRLGARASTIPPGDLTALGRTTAALSAQAEAFIRLAAVPWGDLPAATQGLARSGGPLAGGGAGGGTTIVLQDGAIRVDARGSIDPRAIEATVDRSVRKALAALNGQVIGRR